MGITRSTLLKRAAGASGAALAVGATAGWLAGSAAAAPADEMDLAWVRFGITAEFVSADYYRLARRSGLFRPAETRTLERATAAQNAHRKVLRETLQNNGQAPIDDADIEIVFPANAFDTRQRAVGLGRRLQSSLMSAYLGAVTTVQDQTIRQLFAQLAASESEQLTFLRALTGPSLTDPFPPVHGIATAADEFARYTP